MAFKIESEGLTTFLNETRIKLPRFQRKATWKDDQKFQLCISVFKGYPVGVVIYNRDKDGIWLLDGRQRRNALKTAWENPVDIYNYASSLFRFKTSTQPDEITEWYWQAVNSYLQKDKSETPQGNDQSEAGEEIPHAETTADGDVDIVDIDPETQKGHLKTLLNIILMIHGKKNGVSAWERRFDFSKFISYLPYMQNGKVDPKELKRFLLDWDARNPKRDANEFAQYMIDKYRLADGADGAKFKEHIENVFDALWGDKETVRDAEKVFTDARIGVISLTNVSPLDAQNIFSLVNSGGTKLKPEELLSAKPFWNVPVKEQLLNPQILASIHELYRALNIPGEDEINTSKPVRWDICAMLLDRIDKNHLFFPAFKPEEFNVINMNKIALGFKLVSAEATGGVSAKHIEKMESCKDWENTVLSLIENVNRIADTLLQVNFYQDLIAWGKSIWDLLKNGPSLEFLTILNKNWKELGEPIVDGTKRRTFIINSLVLLDKLIFEYSNNQWRGSGDSKMAHDIENISGRFDPEISTQDWKKFIEDACKPTTNASYRRFEAALYYFTILQKQRPALIQTTYDLDHIVPQSRLESVGDTTLKSRKDTLGNLALLPHRANIKKNDKLLNEIENDLKAEVSRYSYVALEDFGKYSDVTNLPELCEMRKKVFLSAVGKQRDSLFANGSLI